jgi:hypothetical protein
VPPPSVTIYVTAAFYVAKFKRFIPCRRYENKVFTIPRIVEEMRKTFMLFFEAYFYQQNLIFGGGGTGV